MSFIRDFLDSYSLEEYVNFFPSSNKKGFGAKEEKVGIKERIEEYKHSLTPTAFSVVSKTDTVSLICVDIDAHHGEDIEPTRKIIVGILTELSLSYSFEKSGKGYHFWIGIDKEITKDTLEPFATYLEQKSKEIQVFPNSTKHTKIRFPGLYKTHVGYSKDENDLELNTFERVEEFFERCVNQCEKVIDICETFDVATIQAKKRKQIDKKIKSPVTNTAQSICLTYHKAILEYVIGSTFEYNKQIRCPFHKDESPSAIVYENKDENGKPHPKLVCFSSSCNFSEAKNRTLFDLLHFKMFRKLKADSITTKAAMIFLQTEILPMMFKGCLTVDKTGKPILNMIKFSEVLYRFTLQGENDCILFDENKYLYKYNKETKLWDCVADSSKGQDTIIYTHLKDTITKWYCGDPSAVFFIGHDNLTQLSVAYKHVLQANPFVPFSHAHKDICVKNGILKFDSLLSGNVVIVPHKKEDYVISVLNSEYNPEAKNEIFLTAVKRYLPNSREYRLFQQFMGICLVPQIPVSRMLCMVGYGANGKSTLIACLKHLLNGLVSSQKIHNFGNNFALSPLYNKYVNIDGDGEDKPLRSEATAILKAILGHDGVSLEKKYKDSIDVMLMTKLITLLNRFPSFEKSGEDIWRRFMIIEFNYTIPESERKEDFPQTVIEQGGVEGILNFALEGLKDYVQNNNRFTEKDEAKFEYAKDTPDIAFLSAITDRAHWEELRKINPKLVSSQVLNQGVTISVLWTNFTEYFKITFQNRALAHSMSTFSRIIPKHLKSESSLSKHVRNKIVMKTIHNQINYFVISDVVVESEIPL